MSALASGRACPPAAFNADYPRCSLPVHSGPPMCFGLCSLPEWRGLRLLGLYGAMRASRSAVTPDSGALWLAPPVLPLASANSDMIGWSRVLRSHTLDAARSY